MVAGATDVEAAIGLGKGQCRVLKIGLIDPPHEQCFGHTTTPLPAYHELELCQGIHLCTVDILLGQSEEGGVLFLGAGQCWGYDKCVCTL
jgi:hypothetical protein